MPPQKQNELADLPEDLREYLATIDPLSQEDQELLRTEAAKLERDREFQADYIKGNFVEEILQAMDEAGVKKIDLAKRWGRSRQYLNKVLDEDKRVNFTVETMVDLSILLDRRLEVHCLKTNEAAQVLRCKVFHPSVAPSIEFDSDIKPSNVLTFEESDYGTPGKFPDGQPDQPVKLRA